MFHFSVLSQQLSKLFTDKLFHIFTFIPQCVPDVDETDQSESQTSTNSPQKSSKISHFASTLKCPTNAIDPDWSD